MIGAGLLARPQLLVGIILISVGMFGFLAYVVDWGIIVGIYEMRILLIPIGIGVMIYQFLNPLVLFIALTVIGGLLYFLT